MGYRVGLRLVFLSHANGMGDNRSVALGAGRVVAGTSD